MKARTILIISIIFVIVIGIATGVYFAFWGNHGNSSQNLVIDSRDDLSEILGFEFTDANISDIYFNQKSYCICAVLDMSYEEFLKDPITDNGLFYKEDIELSLQSLKRSFPDTFISSIEKIEDGNGELENYIIEVGDTIYDYPYYVQWFSLKEPEEKCVIYAFLPKEIESVSVDVESIKK